MSIHKHPSLLITIALSALVSTIIMLSGYALLRADGMPKWQSTITFAGTLSGTTRQNVQLKFTFYKGGMKCGEYVGKANFLVDDSFKSDIDLADPGLSPCMPLFDGMADVVYDVVVREGDTGLEPLRLTGQSLYGVPFALHAGTADSAINSVTATSAARSLTADSATVANLARIVVPDTPGWHQAGADRYIYTGYWNEEKTPGSIPPCMNGITKVDIGGPFDTTRDLIWTGRIYVAGRDGGFGWDVQVFLGGDLYGSTTEGYAPQTWPIGKLQAPVLERIVDRSNHLWVDVPCSKKILQLSIQVDSFIRTMLD